MKALALDALAVRVTRALQLAGVPVLMMKGPLMAQWLYEGAEDRQYSDVDLLIPPSARRDAQQVLRELGLLNLHDYVLGVYLPSHEEAWSADEGFVDLHWSMAGIPPARWDGAWCGYRDDAEVASLHGIPVAVVGPRGRTLNLALHAAGSRPGDKAREDLRRGLERLDGEAWVSAREAAEEAGALEAFVSGLSLLPEGRQVLERLSLATKTSLRTRLYDSSAPPRVLMWADRPQLLRSSLTEWRSSLLQVRSADLRWRTRTRRRLSGAVDVVRGRVQFALWTRRVGLRDERPFQL